MRDRKRKDRRLDSNLDLVIEAIGVGMIAGGAIFLLLSVLGPAS